MTHNKQITLTVAGHRKSTSWQPQTMLLSALYDKLKTPARGTETMQTYLSLKKAEQDDKKDVGGFVAGTLSGPRRKAEAVTGRDIITLDLDNIPAGGAADILQRLESLGCGYCVYSTRKHMPTAPRLRILAPLDRTVTADEYGPIARRLASYIDMTMCDPTTFEPARLMYWPSVCADGEYIWQVGDKPLLSADGMLATYTDWKDMASWPQVPGEAGHARLAARQGDPLTKTGVVGAFCRVYDVYKAMETFLQGVYAPVETADDRFTFTGGSTTGGAVVYDGGRYLYSHHATDPCGGRLVNAFDLVRLHRFGPLDDEAKEGTPANRLPSYLAMCQLAVGDREVSGLLLQERRQTAATDFEGLEARPPQEDTGWLQSLDLDPKSGQVRATIDNLWRIMEHDPHLRGRFALNEFAGRGEVLGPLPWKKEEKRRFWGDNDSHGLCWYMEQAYGITGTGKIDAALSLHSDAHSFNDVTGYLDGLRWDGVRRLDTLLIDYLGAEDTPYTRAVTRKAFVAAVARAYEPGIKYDTMLILSGPQGIGKSLMLDKMAKGWFNDAITTFEGKEASELLQGVWLVEIAELDAFRKTDVQRVKQFVSQRADRFRAAYGRHVQDIPRCCVFFGTTNTREFLRDETGGRRFWPVDVGLHPRAKTVWADLDGDIDQIWAEAVARWRVGEPLILPNALQEAALVQQELHREVGAREGIILDFLAKEVPEDWQGWPLDKRRVFWAGGIAGDIKLVPRDKICALEVWCEALHGAPRDMRRQDAKEINGVLAAAPGWTRTKNGVRCGYCGYQRGFVHETRRAEG